jgi:hypothetical protein
MESMRGKRITATKKCLTANQTFNFGFEKQQAFVSG